MTGFADDPDIAATFRAEVADRLASLSAGLVRLTGRAEPGLLAGMFRDAHTVKGSARMLGLTDVVDEAHRVEDLLGALRDGRVAVDESVVDRLLAGCDAIARAVAGTAGEPVTVDPAVDPATVDPATVDPASQPGPVPAAVRVSAGRVADLVDTVAAAQSDAHRLAGGVDALALAAAAQVDRARALADLLGTDVGRLTERAGAALGSLLTAGEGLVGQARRLEGFADDAVGRLATAREDAQTLALVPVSRVFAGFPRLVRDLAVRSGKQVRLRLLGEDVQVDKQALDAVADALRHLVVNAVDHGCETPAVRRAAGKPEQATVTVRARLSRSGVTVQVSDDGAGVDEAAVRRAAVDRGLIGATDAPVGPALLRLLFAPAVTTAGAVTDTSGRGVGLDAVRAAVTSLGGAVEARSEPGRGSTFTVAIPVTRGVLRCLIAVVGGERYAVPVQAVAEAVGLRDVVTGSLAGRPLLVRDGRAVPLVDLAGLLAAPAERPTATAALLLADTDEPVAFSVDRLAGERDLLARELGPFLGLLPGLPSAAVDVDGAVVLVLDLHEWATTALTGRPLPAAVEPTRRTAAVDRPPARVLVVEDSVGVRELQRVILEGAGYTVLTAVDGVDGAARLAGDPVDLVITDVEMPGMDGFQLTRELRATPRWEQVPVVVVTARGDDADRRAGLEAGANAYLLKTEFDQTTLLDTVRRLVGEGG